ncbi:YheC/YheD family endospore coat-associated protein [Alicyclobacillus suci]|uniref:YheC/YheD family endospore coat-associated protein n=1 Tax=Alicyclobacillus suci TaxID=2816080 RepID=UPI001A8E3F0A|nr:YheC/YheD family protein [Alicyclobacillus suci]
MSQQPNAEMVWLRQKNHIVHVVQPRVAAKSQKWPAYARVLGGQTQLPITQSLPQGQILYRCPVSLYERGAVAEVGPVFAILAGEGNNGFVGARLNFRDVIECGRKQGAFVYVVAANDVHMGNTWFGYVRLGHQRWIRIPCPRPHAVYNRIPTRALERRKSAIRARQVIRRLGIPMFNREYFNKARIYALVRNHGLSSFLPDTEPELNRERLFDMLQKHASVYLKPAGGSVGHGMVRIDSAKSGWTVAVLKRGQTNKHACATADALWQMVQRERVPGRYVIQQAIPLVEYRGRPCDFRVLLQKQDGTWQVVGRGVRVSGIGRITTHVPNGGSIANADTVLKEAFGDAAERVNDRLVQSVLDAARAIDDGYQGELGEMSMDIGIDPQGHAWFFEANAKPMKFDEPEIRRKSLEGVIQHLRERAGL